MARSRRGRGEGGIYQRASDGLWVATLSWGVGGDGKRRRVVYGKTKREVQAELDRLRSEAKAGHTPDAARMTVAHLLDRVANGSAAHLAARTVEERRKVIENHLKPHVGGVRLANLNAMHVESLYAELRAAGVGRPTVRTAANILGLSLNAAVRLRLIPANPRRRSPGRRCRPGR